MVELVVSYCAKALLLITGLIAYVYLIAFLYPKLLLQTGKRTTADRGLKKYRCEGGRAIAYEPGIAARRYVRQYILTDIQGEKRLRCQLSPEVTSIVYEISVFDWQNRCIHTAVITEPEIQTPGLSESVRLPAQASYIHLTVREVNELLLPGEGIDRDGWKRIGIFTALTVVTTVIESLVLNSVLIFAADMGFQFTQTVGGYSLGLAFLEAVIIGCLMSLLIVRSHCREALRGHRIRWRQLFSRH